MTPTSELLIYSSNYKEKIQSLIIFFFCNNNQSTCYTKHTPFSSTCIPTSTCQFHRRNYAAKAHFLPLLLQGVMISGIQPHRRWYIKLTPKETISGFSLPCWRPLKYISLLLQEFLIILSCFQDQRVYFKLQISLNFKTILTY